MALRDDLLSRDATRIWEACGAVRRLRDLTALRELAVHRAEIEAATDGIELGGALRPNATHLNFALRKLAWVSAERGCLCGLYPTDDLFDPTREAEGGHVRILQEAPDEYLCACTHCGAKFTVQEQQYHYSWWTWQPVTE